MSEITLDEITNAMRNATLIIFVCQGQRNLYQPLAPSTIIHVGVPMAEVSPRYDAGRPLVFLSIGIVCPRKNQIWAVRLFKKFSAINQNSKLVIVGARRTRSYECDYLNQLIEEIGNDSRIALHDVCDNVDRFYQQSSCLLFTSTNEVTPLVIAEVYITTNNMKKNESCHNHLPLFFLLTFDITFLLLLLFFFFLLLVSFLLGANRKLGNVMGSPYSIHQYCRNSRYGNPWHRGLSI